MSNPLPSELLVSDVKIKNKTPTSVTESFSGFVNVKKRNVQWWEIKFTTTATGQEQVRKLEAFADSLNGRYDTFEIKLGSKGEPLKRIRGNAYTEATAAGKNQIKVNGISGVFSTGDFLKFGNHSKMYRVISYDRNTLFANIQPALRKAVSNRETILYKNLPFKVRLKKDDVTYDYIDTENMLEIKFDTREVL